jgi:hypothetical protein
MASLGKLATMKRETYFQWQHLLLISDENSRQVLSIANLLNVDKTKIPLRNNLQ